MGENISEEMMKELGLEEIQKTELDILLHINEFCKENGICYYLDGGTCIGAIRHNGFIPWDDDIDIIMRRRDYNRFLECYSNQDNAQYKILTHTNNSTYYYTFAKIVNNKTLLVENNVAPIDGLGVYIDVFPCDSLPTSVFHRKCMQNAIRFYKFLASTGMVSKEKYTNYGKIKKLAYKLLCIYGWQRALDRIDTICNKAANKPAKYIFDVVGSTEIYRFVPAYCFGLPTYTEFEGHLLPVPTDYDCYLRELYGDYMKLPPVEKRVAKHDYIAYRLK